MKNFSWTLCIVVSISCSGSDGEQGLSSLVSISAEPAGANCPDGGLRIDSGLDDGDGGGTAGDGTLDAGEIDDTEYVCNGADGSEGEPGDPGDSGETSLVDVVVEAPGENCADGGQRVNVGLDNGDGGGVAGDGILQSGEIDVTRYVCNGADGADGSDSLVAIAAEAAGANCPNGGQRVDVGADNGDGGGTAGDGTLQAGEIDFTAFVCDGADGYNSLLTLTEEPSGANCAAGGIRVDVGLDNGDGGGTAGDGTLQAGEIDDTDYVCDGSSTSCATDADCGGALESCQGQVCVLSLTRFSNGGVWPDQACNPTNSFGFCDTNAQDHADAWARAVCQNNGWDDGVWTGNKVGGCGNGATSGQPSTSMWCQGQIPCDQLFENTCAPTDQTIVEFTCTRAP